MSLTPAMMMTAAGELRMTSRSNRAPIWSLRSPLTPRFSTTHSGCPFISQYAYWLVSSPDPFGGASTGDRYPGVPAVVESPSATIVIDAVIDDDPGALRNATPNATAMTRLRLPTLLRLKQDRG